MTRHAPGLRTPGALLLFLLPVVAIGCRDIEPQPETAERVSDGTIQLTAAQMTAADIETRTIDAVSVRQTVRVPGSVQTPDTAQVLVGSIVEGSVISVAVVAGDVVARGAPLVEIHSHELLAGQRDLSAAEASLAQRGSALERSEALLIAGAVALEEVERRRADFASAEAELRRAEEMVGHLNPTPDGHVTVTAPRAGTVFEVHARPGQAVLPGAGLVEMGSTHVLWVTAFVPEHTASTSRVGDTVAVRFRSPSDAHTSARVIGTGNYVDPTNRSVEMRFELDSIPPGVRPGSFATVEVAASSPFVGVEVDEEVAVRLGDTDVVFVTEGPGSFRALTITAIPIGEGRVAVQGLPDGAEIVVKGAFFLKAVMEQLGAGEEGGDA